MSQQAFGLHFTIFLLGAPCSSRPQSHWRFRHVPGRSHDIALLLGLTKRFAKATSVARAQRRRQVHRPLDDRACFPHLLGWLQSQVLVQATPIKVQNNCIICVSMYQCISVSKKVIIFLRNYILDSSFLLKYTCGNVIKQWVEGTYRRAF